MKKNEKPRDPKVTQPTSSKPANAPGNSASKSDKRTSVDADLERRRNEYRNTRSEL